MCFVSVYDVADDTMFIAFPQSLVYTLIQSGPQVLQGSRLGCLRASLSAQTLAEARVSPTRSPQRVCQAQLGEWLQAVRN